MKRAIRRHHRKRRLASVERRVYAKVLGDRLNRMLANTNIWVRHEEPTSGKRSKKPSDYRADITYREQVLEEKMDTRDRFLQENPYINHSTTQPKQGGFQMEFNDLFQPRAVPTSISLDSSPVDVLTFIKAKGHLALDIDFIDDYINHHTPENPDDWEVDEDCVDEIQHFRNLAERKQEEEEIRWENAVNNPDHPDHQKEWDKLNRKTLWVVEVWDDEDKELYVASSREEAERYLLTVVFNDDFDDFEQLESYRGGSFRISIANKVEMKS